MALIAGEPSRTRRIEVKAESAPTPSAAPAGVAV
jgi:hypothetical protein